MRAGLAANGVRVSALMAGGGASLVAQLVKNLSAVQETPLPSLSREDALEKGKATHSSILAWRSPCGYKESDLHFPSLQV